MFRTPRTNVIQSDEGFSVEVLGRTGLLYSEGLKRMRIDSELVVGPNMAVFRKSIKRWQFPFCLLRIGAAERERIVDNIRRAFRSQGHEIEVA